MILVNQNRKMLVNFDHVSNIDIVEHENRKVVVCYDAHQFFVPIELGEYETVDRCKNVLSSILNAYGLGMYKYQMPLK